MCGLYNTFLVIDNIIHKFNGIVELNVIPVTLLILYKVLSSHAARHMVSVTSFLDAP